MNTNLKIAVLGDYNPTIISHQFIPDAVALASRALSVSAEPIWIETALIEQHDLSLFDAVWCVPGSPYKNRQAVLNAISHARRSSTPFLGTCGGYQLQFWNLQKMS